MNVRDINDDWLTVGSLGHEFSLSALKFSNLKILKVKIVSMDQSSVELICIGK
jgi:hypothetical protein